jgi:uncharacterized protein with HEPN domain
MSRDWRIQLDDIRQAIAKIRLYIDSMDYTLFANDQKTQDAVIRNLEIIGEAARVLPESIKLQASDIEWRKIIALRNLLLHAYFGVSLPIVWDVVCNKLDQLEAACDRAEKENSL